MDSESRVRAALAFQPTDHVCLYDQYMGGFLNAWRRAHGLPPREDVPLDDVVYHDETIQSYYGLDLYKILPDEDPWPSGRRLLERRGTTLIERDGWGRTLRRREQSVYGEAIELPLANKSALDRLEFEPADLDRRYTKMMASIERARAMPQNPYLFIKVGGPFLRSSFLRGDMNWYADIAQDPAFARAVAARVADHLIAVGREALRRSGLRETSVWIFDDIASNRGLLMSPRAYREIFLPETRRMIEAFRAAGAARVGFHSDGDIRAVLDDLVEAGVGILNPIEPRANMDAVELRRRYGSRLALVGGVCNSRILPQGSDAEVRAHVARLLSIAGEGGFVIGSHSICNDVTPARYDLFIDELCARGRPRPIESAAAVG